MEQISQLKRLGLFDARVPRYTSYPTAPHFTDAVGGDTVAHWISAVPAGKQISLYLHIPFCRRLCWFCACRTQGTSTLSPVAGYVETLKTELALIAAQLAPGVTIGHLHWGGGTPTLLSPELITGLAKAIRAAIPFAPDAQFSVEIDPTELDAPRMDALAAAGMTRASIGVQDFDPAIQEAIGRPQSYDATRDAVEGLRARGITSLNADILYGLPYQTREKVAASVQKLLSLSPDRVALFGYAHVPWMAKRQQLIPNEALPLPPERLELFETARQLFLWDGYQEIGIDHFARPEDGLAFAQREGRLKRNFQGYTDDRFDTLIGVGASAISRFPQGYAQNDPRTSGYQSRVRAGRLTAAKGHVFAGDDLLRAHVIERLLCDFEVDFGALAAEGTQHLAALLAQAASIDTAFPGMTTFDNAVLRITEAGRPLARMIARYFDAYEAEKARHSSAI